MRLALPRNIPDVLCTKGEAAELLGLSPAQVSRLCRRGLLTEAGAGVFSLRTIARYVGRTRRRDKKDIYARLKRVIAREEAA